MHKGEDMSETILRGHKSVPRPAAWLMVLALAVMACVSATPATAPSSDPGTSSAEAGFWSDLRIEGDEVEGYGSLREMKAHADAVVTGRFDSFALSRTFQGDAPEDVTAYAVAEVVVDARLRGVVPDRLKLEFLLPVPSDRAAAAVKEMANTMPTGDLVLFLRAKRGPDEDGLYRIVNSVGLWTATDRASVDAPLREEPDGIGLYAAELRSVRSLDEFVREIREL